MQPTFPEFAKLAKVLPPDATCVLHGPCFYEDPDFAGGQPGNIKPECQHCSFGAPHCPDCDGALDFIDNESRAKGLYWCDECHRHFRPDNFQQVLWEDFEPDEPVEDFY